MPRGRPKKREALTDEQIEAIQNLDEAMSLILNQFRFLNYPSLHHMIKFDDAYSKFYFHFSKVLL